jgi:hypothetical protein
MDEKVPAMEFPGMYRSVLDVVAELEREGRRPDASRVRAQATRTYSGAWDARGLRRLEKLHRDALRTLGQTRDARPTDLRRSGELA